MNKIKLILKWLASFWPFMEKGEFFKIILSFILLIWIGNSLNSNFQKETWERQIRYELLKNEIQDDRKTVSDMTSLIEQRLFTAQQYIWAVKDGKTNTAEEAWKLYMETVKEWNKNSLLIQSKLTQMSGYKISDQFLSDTSDGGKKEPKSIHYKFTQIHNSLLYLKDCNYVGCDQQRELLKLQKYITSLIEQESNLIAKLNEATNIKYNNLKLSPSEYLKATTTP